MVLGAVGESHPLGCVQGKVPAILTWRSSGSPKICICTNVSGTSVLLFRHCETQHLSMMPRAQSTEEITRSSQALESFSPSGHDQGESQLRAGPRCDKSYYEEYIKNPCNSLQRGKREGQGLEKKKKRAQESGVPAINVEGPKLNPQTA